MIKASYEQLIEKIARGAAITIEEVERRIDAKRAKLSGLISKEGAAQIVAAELGVSFDKQKVKISELLSGMRKISVNAKVVEIYPIRTFKKEGNENKVATMLIADETSSARTVLWDINHIKLIETKEIREGSVIEIKDASVRAGELHLGNISSIKPINEEMSNIVIKQNFEERNIESMQANMNCTVRAAIVQIFEPRFFAVCPECSSKLQQDIDKFICATHGNVIPSNRAIVSLVIDDGTENIRAVCFNEAAKKLFGFEDIEMLKDTNYFLGKKDELLGKELSFSGRGKQNKLFGNLEFIVSDINEVKVQELIQKLSR